MGFSNDRANHSLEVAKQMYEKALEQSGDEYYARKMFHLGLVHDIGYQFTENTKEHSHVGGRFLKEEGYEYWEEVYQHGNPAVEEPSEELKLLNWADMHTDGKGNRVSFEERLKDIEERYGTDSEEYILAKRVINNMRDLAKNEMKTLLGDKYDEENHMLNWIRYWIRNDNPNSRSEKWRLQNELDCIYIKSLNADTIVSMFQIFERVYRCFNGGGKNKKTKEWLEKFDSRSNFDEFFSKDDELVVLLQRLAFLAEGRANYMLLPDRSMQRRGIWYADEMPPSLYQCFAGGKFSLLFKSEKDLQDWIIEQKLQMYFKEGRITREDIIPVIEDFPNEKSMKNTIRRDLLKELMNYNISMLEKRGKLFGIYA